MKSLRFYSNPVVWKGEELRGIVIIKRPKQFYSVRWEVHGLDRLSELSDQFLCAEKDEHEAEWEKFCKPYHAIASSRRSHITGCMRWGQAKGLDEPTAMLIKDVILAYWNRKIVEWNCGREESQPA